MAWNSATWAGPRKCYHRNAFDVSLYEDTTWNSSHQLNLTDEESTAVQAMACCCQAPSYYPSLHWPSSMSPYDSYWATALQWCHNEPDGVSDHQPHDCLLNRYSGADHRKHQSSVSLAFVRGIHRWPWGVPWDKRGGGWRVKSPVQCMSFNASQNTCNSNFCSTACSD